MPQPPNKPLTTLILAFAVAICAQLGVFSLPSALAKPAAGSLVGDGSGKTTKNLSAAFRSGPVAPIPSEISAESLPDVFSAPAPRSADDLKALEAHVAGLAERLHPTTIAIVTDNATGSGVIISPDGLILTAGHVFERPGRKIRVIFPDGSVAQGTSLGHNEQIDSGLCKITDPAPEGGWPFAPIGDLKDSKPGDFVLAIGHPGGYQAERPYVVRLGRLIAKRPTVLQTDATVVGGDSGGPLFDMHGRVIGIHSRINNSLNGNFHIPITTYLETWDRLNSDEHWGQSLPSRLAERLARPQLGIEGRNNPDGTGAVVDVVIKKTPAAEAGLKIGDIITHFDGKTVRTFAELRLFIVRAESGKKIRLTILRDGQTQQIDLTLSGR